MDNINLVTGIYDKSNLLVMDEHPSEHEFDERYYLTNNTTLLISFEDIDLYSYMPINYSKLYYHPNKDMSYNGQRTTPFLNEAGIYNFFETNFHVNNSISFKVHGEWYSLSTNAEYILQPIIDHNAKHIRLYFNDDPSFFYKIKKGKYRFKKINKIHLPKPTIFSYDLMDLYLFEGYDFIEDYSMPNIVDIKNDIKNILVGLDYYFVGTSIHDNARDIDIFIPPNQYEEAVRLLEEKYEKIKDSKGHLGCLFKTPIDIKIDLMPSPYNDEILSVKDNAATPLFMYFIQANYYVSIKNDNVSELFKIWRFNKLLETGSSLGILSTQYNYFKNTFLTNDRFELYQNVISNSTELVDDIDIGAGKMVSYQNSDKYYFIIKSLHPGQIIKFDFPGKLKNVNVIDDQSIDNVTICNDNDVTHIHVFNLNGYTLIECELYE